jgi:hypothetical protein
MRKDGILLFMSQTLIYAISLNLPKLPSLFSSNEAIVLVTKIIALLKSPKLI